MKDVSHMTPGCGVPKFRNVLKGLSCIKLTGLQKPTVWQEKLCMTVTLAASISLFLILVLLTWTYISYQKFFRLKNINHIYTFNRVLLLSRSNKTRKQEYVLLRQQNMCVFNKFTRSENKMGMSLKHRKQVHHTSTASCTTFAGVTGTPKDPFLYFWIA